MKMQNMLPFRAWTPAVAILSIIAQVSADDLFQSYCSTQNTGSSYAAVTNIYNSDGSCHDQCLAKYAFAVVQWQQCWCSNYIPAVQVDTGLCNAPCPGFQSDLCGNLTAGLFGYIQLSVAPSGTAGGSSTSTKTTKSSSSSTPSTTTSTTSSTTSTSTTPPPQPSTQIITISGVTVTQFVTPTPVPSGESSTVPTREQRSSGLSGGAIAGIVIGSLAGVALLILAAVLLWRRRRSEPDENGPPGSRSGMSKIPGRNISVLSKAGLVGRARPGTAEDENLGQGGTSSVRHSMMMGAGNEVSPVSPLGSSQDNDSRRHSRPFVYDQRLNPSALFPNQEASGSRVSMQDTQDYSRPLGIANPDPRASFDSRLSQHH